MSSKRILTALVAVLVLINIGLVYLHFFVPHHHKGRDVSNESWLDRSLNLTDSQIVKHVALRRAYFKELEVFNDSIKQIKSRFIAVTATQGLSDSLSTFWTDSINRWHRRADERTYQHVCNVRNILTPEQQPIFDSLIQLTILRRHREDDDH